MCSCTEARLLERQARAAQRQADAAERQAETMEAVATELRYQNAALVETIATLEAVARRVGGQHVEYEEPPNRSGAALQTAIADRLFDRDDREENENLGSGGLARAENWDGGSR